jgi:acetyl esterase
MSTDDWPGLDPRLLDWLDTMPALPADATIEEARERVRAVTAGAFGRLGASLRAAAVRDELLDGPAGPLQVRIFTPPPAEGPVPVIVFSHGGGWMTGDIESHLAHGHRLSVEAGAVVVSVDFRRAPEHRFPAAFDDCWAATQWAAAQASALGGDPALLVVAGDSAGGQLAASVAIACRDAGVPLAAQLLLYPVTSVGGRYEDAAINANYPSRIECPDAPGARLADMVACARAYVDESDSTDWRVSPLDADLRGVASAVVHTATYDVLRDDGNRFAEALRAAGVRVAAREFRDVNHGYYGLGGVSEAADARSALASADLRSVLGKSSRPTEVGVTPGLRE